MQPNQKALHLQSVKIDPLMLKDTWDAVLDLGIEVQSYHRLRKLNFGLIEQDWLKHNAKLFIKYVSTNKAFQTIRGYLRAIVTFSKFLSQEYFLNEIEEITRSVIIDYLVYLNHQKMSAAWKCHCLYTLKNLFQTGTINGWFELQPYLILPEDSPKEVKTVPRYIPEEVMQQLNQHLDALPEPVMRMVLLIQECGLRIGELLQLPLDCLKRDTKGDFFIQFVRWKMKKESTIPISKEAAAVIQEQQQFIRDNLGENFHYLFCARKSAYGFKPKPVVMGLDTLNLCLNKLAAKFDIKDNSGKIWKFQSHQFRHTVATRMINSGVQMHIIQRYLGHDTPNMTQRYAHIHDTTLKKEIAEFHGKVVNVFGQIVESENPELDSDADLQWMKKKVLAQALPNGSCARPVIKGPCPHANACLSCADFRTTREFLDEHKQQLEQTEKIIEKAKANGWQRQLEMNEQVKTNLENIIQTLENDAS